MGKYHFKVEERLDKIVMGSGKLCNFSEDGAIVYGKLKSLFGEPIYESENYEDQYTYVFSVSDEAGEEFCIYAYSGSTGPAIGGLQNEESRQAAAELMEMMQTAFPVDFDYVGYYMDGPCKVYEGIKNGEAYHRDEFDIPEEELAEVAKRIYCL